MKLTSLTENTLSQMFYLEPRSFYRPMISCMCGTAGLGLSPEACMNDQYNIMHEWRVRQVLISSMIQPDHVC